MTVPPVIQVQQDDTLQRLIPIILAQIQAKKQRKDEQAQRALAGVPEGTLLSELSPSLRDAFERVRGIDPDVADPSTVIRETTVQGTIARFMQDATGSLSPEQQQAAKLGTLRSRTGPFRTAEGLEAETRTVEAEFQGRRILTEAGADALAGLDQDQLADFGIRNFTGTSPELLAFEKENVEFQQRRLELTKDVLNDPNHPFNVMAQGLTGMSAADLVGGVGLGLSNLITARLQIATQAVGSAAERQSLWDRATVAAAQSLAEQIDLPGANPRFMERILAGDKRVMDTPLGQAVTQSMMLGFQESLDRLALTGSPQAIALKEFLPLFLGVFGRDEKGFQAGVQAINTFTELTFPAGALPKVITDGRGFWKSAIRRFETSAERGGRTEQREPSRTEVEAGEARVLSGEGLTAREDPSANILVPDFEAETKAITDFLSRQAETSARQRR